MFLWHSWGPGFNTKECLKKKKKGIRKALPWIVWSVAPTMRFYKPQWKSKSLWINSSLHSVSLASWETVLAVPRMLYNLPSALGQYFGLLFLCFHKYNTLHFINLVYPTLVFFIRLPPCYPINQCSLKLFKYQWMSVSERPLMPFCHFQEISTQIFIFVF